MTIHGNAGGKGHVDNTGTVSSGTPDPKPVNNSSSIRVGLK